MAMKPSVSIIIPTYNERGNIEKLVPELFAACRGLKPEVIVVDDSSPDGTASVVKNLSSRHNVRVIIRPGKLGLASAVILGFSQAKSDIIGVMDADLSHPPEIIPKLIKPLLGGSADFAIGSRYIEGGGVEVWPFHRRLTSRIATLLALPLTRVSDPMSGLFFFRRSVIDGIHLDAKGYKIGLEVLVKGKYSRLVEVPYLFRNRFVGKSKLTASEYAHYLRNLAVLAFYKLRGGHG